ncbi:MAG: LamG-like jellyroll fold domain-containing protein [Acidobacteriota bacterium]
MHARSNRHAASRWRLSLVCSLLLIALVSANPADADVVGRWTFDDPADLGADSSGNGLDATLHGVQTATGRPLPGGGNSDALSFDGIDDYLRIAGAPSLDGASAVTLESWVRVPTATFGRNIFRIRKPLALHPDQFQLYSSATGWRTLNTASPVPLDTWYHLAAVFDRSETRIYVNGRLANLDLPATETFGSPVSFSEWSIGARLVNAAPDQFFAGLIDEVTVHDEALPAATLLAHAQDADLGSPTTVTTLTGTAIQSALDTAGAGGEVILESGTYLLTQPLLLPDRILLRGPAAGSLPAVLKPDVVNHAIVSPMLFVNGRQEVTLRDFRIDGAATEQMQSSGHAGILITSSTVVHVDNVRIEDLGRDSTTSGAHLRIEAYEDGLAPGATIAGETRVDGVPAERNVIENSSTLDPTHLALFGIRFWTEWSDLTPGGSYDGLIRWNVVQNNFVQGFTQGVEIAGPATEENLIRDNDATGAWKVGIEADKGTKRNRFLGNKVTEVRPNVFGLVAAMFDQGIPSAGHWNEGNEFRNNTLSGIGDSVDGKWAGGIYLHYTRDGFFQTNTISDVTGINANREAAVLLQQNEVVNYVHTPNTVEAGLAPSATVP